MPKAVDSQHKQQTEVGPQNSQQCDQRCQQQEKVFKI